MATSPGPLSPHSGYRIVLALLFMVALPAALALHSAHVPPVVDPAAADPSPYGYTWSLLLFVVPILVIAVWFLPQEDVHVSRRSFLWTIGLLFPLGALMDFFFANTFFTFGNAAATLGWRAPALHGGVPVEEYLFYLTGFIACLLLYIWLDEYWLAAYGTPSDSPGRTSFHRLLRFHPASLVWAVVLIAAAIAYRRLFVPAPGFPFYFLFLTVASLAPSAALLPSVMPMINWRAFSMTVFVLLLVSLLWEATLGLPYRWWGYQPARMIGPGITAWNHLPIEAVVVWIAVSYATVIVYETVRMWQASGRPARRAFLG